MRERSGFLFLTEAAKVRIYSQNETLIIYYAIMQVEVISQKRKIIFFYSP